MIAETNERAAAYSTFFAYAGRYSLANGKVTHHVEASSLQNYVNTDQIRVVVSVGKDQLILRTTTPLVWDGVRYAYQELVWKRLKQ
jgi:hypothetical protein